MAARFLLVGDVWEKFAELAPMFYDLANHMEREGVDCINMAQFADDLEPNVPRGKLDKFHSRKIMQWALGRMYEADTVGIVMLPHWQDSKGAMALLTMARFYGKGILGAFPRSGGDFFFIDIDGVTKGKINDD